MSASDLAVDQMLKESIDPESVRGMDPVGNREFAAEPK
jgi:hypothetical protein